MGWIDPVKPLKDMYALCDLLTTIYTIVDDAMKGSAVIQEVLDRPGPGVNIIGIAA
jgi:hypothetical protein